MQLVLGNSTVIVELSISFSQLWVEIFRDFFSCWCVRRWCVTVQCILNHIENKANIVSIQCINQTLFFHNVQRHLFLQSINNINRRKSEFLIEMVIICDLEWPLRSYLILWKICIFTMLALIKSFNKIGS